MARPTLTTLPAPDSYDIFEKSAETMNWLRSNIAVGFTSERGPAWWANSARTKAGDWTEIPDGSHFDGPVPMEKVNDILDVRLVKGRIERVAYEDADGVTQYTSTEDNAPIVNARTGKIFSWPKSSYAIHPYLETLHGFVQQILFDERVGVGSVGLLKGGGQAFLQAVLPEEFEVAGYGYVPYAMATTSCDLSRSTAYSMGFEGAVCDNTVTSALSKALAQFRRKHTKNSRVSVQAARDKLGIRLQAAGEEIGKTIEELVNIDVTPAQYRGWLDLAVPLKNEDGTLKEGRAQTMALNKRDALELLRKDAKVKPWDGTAFGILQLDNTYRTWNQTVKSADGARVERNFFNVANGVTEAADLAALDMLAKVQERTMTFA